MYIIVGLGNPGRKYANTRHNLGFMVLDELAHRCRKTFTRDHLLFENIQIDHGSQRLLLVKPMTYMNRSGEALRAIADSRSVDLSKCLVVLDDFALPLGRIRARPSGSAGGHNGLDSIIQSLETEDFPRLRLGIGLEPDLPVVDYVLSDFTDEEKPVAEKMVCLAADAVLDYLENGIHHTMNHYNSLK